MIWLIQVSFLLMISKRAEMKEGVITMLKSGLYEQIISQALSHELASVSDACKHVEKLDAAEAPQALAGYVAEAVRAALEAISNRLGVSLPVC